jgi:hypothetical protein
VVGLYQATRGQQVARAEVAAWLRHLYGRLAAHVTSPLQHADPVADVRDAMGRHPL